MPMLVRAVRMLAWIWLFAAAVLILVGYASTWYRGGFAALWELLEPNIVTNSFAVVLTLAPAYFLYKLAGGIQDKSRGKVLCSAVALGVSVTAVALIALLPVALERNETKNAREQGKAREYEAQSILVKDQSATMYQYKDQLLTALSGPGGNGGMPESIQIGEAITVEGHTMRAKHILVKEILSDINYGGQVLGKAGEAQCVITESRENLPSAGESARGERLWIMVEKCVPLAVATQ